MKDGERFYFMRPVMARKLSTAQVGLATSRAARQHPIREIRGRRSSVFPAAHSGRQPRAPGHHTTGAGGEGCTNASAGRRKTPLGTDAWECLSAHPPDRRGRGEQPAALTLATRRGRERLQIRMHRNASRLCCNRPGSGGLSRGVCNSQYSLYYAAKCRRA